MTNDRHEPGGGHREQRRPQQDRDNGVISDEEVERFRRIEEAARWRRAREYREDRAKFWWAVGAGITIGLGNNLPEWIGRLWRIIGDHVR